MKLWTVSEQTTDWETMFYSTNKLLFYILSFNNYISNVNFYVQQNYINICTVTE